MRAVAIIPARGGSKRIPKKNIKSFCSKPLIYYCIKAAKKSGLFDEIILSTDSLEIAQIAQKYGAKVPFLRPKELSDDFTGTSEVINHALKFLKDEGKNYDFACTIYATAVFLKPKFLIKSFEKLKNSHAKYCFSACSFAYPFWRGFEITKENRCKMFFPENLNKRSQDLTEAFHDAGQFYWENLHVKSDKCMFGEDSIPFVLPRFLVQDIDTPEDWQTAKMMFKALKKRSCKR